MHADSVPGTAPKKENPENRANVTCKACKVPVRIAWKAWKASNYMFSYGTSSMRLMLPQIQRRPVV